MKKRIISLAFALVLIVSICPMAFAAPRGGDAYFTEIKVSSGWSYLTTAYKTTDSAYGTVRVTNAIGGTGALFALQPSTSYYRVGVSAGSSASITLQAPYNVAYQYVPIYGSQAGTTTHVSGYFNAS